MKAFVIKNKAEDRYLYTFYIYGDENFAFGGLNEAKLFDNLDNANNYKERIYWVNSNLKLEVVPITIAEGDLDKLQNQKVIECLKDVLDHFTDRPTFYDHARQEICLSVKDKKFVDYVYSKIKELEGVGNDKKRT